MFAATLLLVSLVSQLLATPMDDYVWKDDPNYSWHDTGKRIHGRNIGGSANYIGYVLNMTSQRWLTDADTTRSLWWHYFVVIVPSTYNPQTARNGTLWITDGSNDSPDELPTRSNYNMIVASELAMGTGLITGCLFQIPNQHMVFAADPKQQGRSEDAIIAFTWAHFLDYPDQPEWLVRLPMVKASMRAMDTMTAFVKEQLHIPHLDYYCVTGASKRGWVTWDVAAVDFTDPLHKGRVAAIAPIVLDAINFVEVEHHQWRSYGGWTFLLEDYYDMNITRRFDDPNMVKLQQIEDPYFYRERLAGLPKLIVNSGADEFQQPDDTHYWWNEMPEPKYFLLMPNTEHATATGAGQCLPAIGTFFMQTIYGRQMPKASWRISEVNGDIHATIHYPNAVPQLNDNSKTAVVYSSNSLVNVTMWIATSCAKTNTVRRDFRFMSQDDPCACGYLSDGTCFNIAASIWSPLLLHPESDGISYRAHLNETLPPNQWNAFFIDFTFAPPVDENSTPTVGYFATKAPENVVNNVLVASAIGRTALKTMLDVESFTYLTSYHGKGDFSQYTVPSTARIGKNNGGFGTWPYDFPGQLDFTTEASIWPNVFPYEDCHGEGCYGTLL